MQMKITITLILCIIYFSATYCQPYTDFIGAGHSKGIVITTSDENERNFFYETASGEKTISGSGLNGKRAEMSRFLSQTSFGYDMEDIDAAITLGKQGWMDKQFASERSNYLIQTDSFAKVLYDFYINKGVDPEDVSPNPDWRHFRYSWWNINTFGKDQLRQRIAYALSQILVVSDDADIGNYARGLASYYDLLSRNAFGNFRDLLLEMTLHPCMGSYLSHLNNPKEIPEENIHPDQNFAREVMQLFTIGLYELNIDGTRKVDGNGNNIPTYNNNDIAELAKVFTGLGISASIEGMNEPEFGSGLYGADMTKPMKMYEEWHQQGEKILFGSHVIPNNQSGMKDISDAIDILFNHPNTGPFISRLLIQRLVSSNPSNEYIGRVASIFNNDGSGVRGNLKATVNAIIMDEEARECEFTYAAGFGKLMEPVLRHTQFLKGVGIELPSGYFFNHGSNLENSTFQHPLSAPSVFNFYSPDYMPTGVLSDSGLVAPEFQILNSLTSLDYANLAFIWNYYEYTVNNWEDDYFQGPTNASGYFEIAHDDEVLINHIDLLFTNGRMSEETRATIKESIKNMVPTLYGSREKIILALYLTFISPDYVIKK
ncbi:MAG: DUF1800 domain-containing protein [Saprospiraceae bacterium]|nr:DUF1800 domain-containing protein [Saprospiraceae bacterium]